MSTLPSEYSGMIVRFRLTNGSHVPLTAWWTVGGPMQTLTAPPQQTVEGATTSTVPVSSVQIQLSNGNRCCCPVDSDGVASCNECCLCIGG